MQKSINVGLAKKESTGNSMLTIKTKNRIKMSFLRNRKSIFFTQNTTVFLFVLLFSINLQSQSSSFYTKSDTLNIKRRNTVAITETVLAAGALFTLDKLWYSDFPRSNFHFINDNSQWKQMDKIGHVLTSYYVGKVGMEVLDWA